MVGLVGASVRLRLLRLRQVPRPRPHLIPPTRILLSLRLLHPPFHSHRIRAAGRKYPSAPRRDIRPQNQTSAHAQNG